ncbi:hypothetical protein D3C76_967770 [compost metagenome]
MLDRPARREPAALAENLHPLDRIFPVQVLALEDATGQALRQFGAQEGADFVTEGEFVRRIADVHRGAPQIYDRPAVRPTRGGNG